MKPPKTGHLSGQGAKQLWFLENLLSCRMSPELETFGAQQKNNLLKSCRTSPTAYCDIGTSALKSAKLEQSLNSLKPSSVDVPPTCCVNSIPNSLLKTFAFFWQKSQQLHLIRETAPCRVCERSSSRESCIPQRVPKICCTHGLHSLGFCRLQINITLYKLIKPLAHLEWLGNKPWN